MDSTGSPSSRQRLTNAFKRRKGTSVASQHSETASLTSLTSTNTNGAPVEADETGGRKLAALLSSKSRRRRSASVNVAGPIVNGGVVPWGAGGVPTAMRNSSTSIESQPQQQESKTLGNVQLSMSQDNSSGAFTDDEGHHDPVRPVISPHQSHAGFLTLSSPLITARTVDSATESPIARPPSDFNTLRPVTSGSSQRRSPSPVGRLKDAFVPSRRRSRSNIRREAEEEEEEEQKKEKQRGRAVTSPPSAPVVSQVFDSPLFQEPLQQTPSPKAPAPRPILTDPPATPPNSNGPATFVTPPTPTDTHREAASLAAAIDEKTDAESEVSSRSQKSVTSHKRAKSTPTQPSKLSNAMSAPLTPALEEVKTPGGGFAAPQNMPNATGGFFSSMFSAAQNAANSLSNTIASSNTKRGPDERGQAGGEEVILPEEAQVDTSAQRQPAIETLGSGNLSLQHLGFTDEPTTEQRDDRAAKAEVDAAARAVSIAYTEQPLAGELSRPEEQAAPAPEESGIRRAGSVRSRLSGSRRRRTRGSSAATGPTVPPGLLSPSTNTLARPTGFAVADAKRNRDFHALFRSVPDDDYLIEDYSAALQRDILLHGRLYISEGHVCFSSNILGWVTNLVISFEEVIAVEKKSTAVIFQNGIVIQTLHARNVFASLLNRDTTYGLIINIWKITHPNLRSSLNGTPIEGTGTGDKTEKAGSVADDDGSVSEDVYDEDAEEDDEADMDVSFDDGAAFSVAGSEPATEQSAAKVLARKASAAAFGPTSPAAKAEEAASQSQDFPGPVTHEATDCGDSAQHYDKLLTDTVIPAPLGKVYSLMFGPASGTFMRKWLVEDQKSLELQLEDDKKGLGPDTKTMTYSYIKPLNGSIGPKQTKCIISQTLEQFDLERAVTIGCSTQNPDVPSGNIFVVKTRYCLMWAANNQTRLISTCTIEWSGKSWLRGPIEKGANDGQTQYAKDLVAALRAAVSVKPTLRPGKAGKKGGKRRREAEPTADVEVMQPAASRSESWGLFEPLRMPLEPITSLVGGMISTPQLIGFLTVMVLLLTWRLWRAGPAATRGVLAPWDYQPARVAAYEAMWKGEEEGLWTWLEERTGAEALLYRGPGVEAEVREMKSKLAAVGGEREAQEAVRVTREKLAVLEAALKQREGAGKVLEKDAGNGDAGKELAGEGKQVSGTGGEAAEKT
ncbi:hypothetical protein EJ06DRAFT_560653 [Trichodelitschia bisporula]|uniref:VASt domain-containing protein n=1 Tax=Trichodelitschia bisporula TaxID=703511 RepID=A0A6G1HI97_9PEZI|nr:hypothetical protein EJ06DRAFT_560653 [Trichodelitschia bisporula]